MLLWAARGPPCSSCGHRRCAPSTRRSGSRRRRPAWRAAATSSRPRRTACLPFRARLADTRRAGAVGHGWARAGTCPGRTTTCRGRCSRPTSRPIPRLAWARSPTTPWRGRSARASGHDGRALFMMPSQEYRSLSDEDVASVVTYLRTLAPVKKARGTTAIAAPVRWFVKAMPEPLTAPVTDAASRRSGGARPSAVGGRPVPELSHAGRRAPPAAAGDGVRGRAGVHDRRRPHAVGEHHAGPVGDLPLQRGAVHPDDAHAGTSARAGSPRSCRGRRSAS